MESSKQLPLCYSLYTLFVNKFPHHVVYTMMVNCFFKGVIFTSGSLLLPYAEGTYYYQFGVTSNMLQVVYVS